MDVVRETFTHKKMAATGQLFTGPGILGGFFCCTAGTCVIQGGAAGADGDIVASFPCTAGVFHPLPFAFANGAYAVLAGGATGTFGIG